MNSTPVKLNDLPDLPFEKILAHLSLEDRLKAMAVSRRWYSVISGIKVESLAFSERPSGFIFGKNRWVNGEFAQNFINSTKFERFFQTFGQSILANLKRLRLCKLDLTAENGPAFNETFNSFGRLKELEELDLLSIHCFPALSGDFRLNLPMLKSVHIENVIAFCRLTLDAPRLATVKLLGSPHVNLVHEESVEKLITKNLRTIKVAKLKNLKYLAIGPILQIDQGLLSTLEHLEEIHLNLRGHVFDLFEQKKRYRRSNLKIFFDGYLLNGPDDLAVSSIYREGYFRFLIENQPKLAMEIPHWDSLPYSAIEHIAPGQEIKLLKPFVYLVNLALFQPVQDVDRFFKILKNLDNIRELEFDCSNQPQQLFDRLPDHCAIQSLKLKKSPADLNFLVEMKSLIDLTLQFPNDIEFVSKVVEELPFISSLAFNYLNQPFTPKIDYPKQYTAFGASLLFSEGTKLSDLNAAIQWVRGKAQQNK